MVIRKCKEDDAKCILEMLLALDKETKYMMLEEGERSEDLLKIEQMIDASVNGGDLLLVAEAENNKIIGFLSAKRGLPRKIRHTAYIVVGIREKYRGEGIGSRLFKELDNWARENNIERLELTVMCENVVAKSLYEKNGFKVEGIKEKSIFMEGKFLHEYYMAKIYD